MKHFYPARLRGLILLCIFISVTGLVAQAQSDSLLHHKIWVKLDRPIPSALHQRSLQDGIIRTGRASLDQLNQDCGVVRIRRVFSPTQKFEKAHQHYGLHLWYEVQFADTLATPVQELAALFCKNISVTTAETIPVRTRYTSATAYNADTVVWGNDPRYEDQWHFENTGQSGGTPGADISLADAWPLASGDSRVIVAVIDGGIDVKHEDLQGAIWVNQQELHGTEQVDDDGNGYVDDIYGYGFGDERGSFKSDQHGTHVAGIIGAVTNNGIGVSGVAGGDGKNAGVRLMSCAIFGSYGQGGFPEAFVYAADNGAVIAQNSWGGGEKSQVLEDAIDYFTDRAGYDNTDENFDQYIQTGPMAGGLVLFAAGNNSSDQADLDYPASLESVLTVASLDHEDTKSDFSNYGDWVDLAAPGSEILSTFPGDDYGYLSGTSMACPQVSGVAALAISRFQHEGFTSDQLRRVLLASGDNIDELNPSYAGELGSGRINAYRLLSSDTEHPPAAIADLASSNTTFNTTVLSWTATGADGTAGTATQYDLRMAAKPIVDSTFSKAERVVSGVVPASAGALDSITVKGLQADSSYYFALKVVDLFGNQSLLSNVVKVTTAEPPRLELQPVALSATIEARETVEDTFIIDNSLGKSALSFHLSLDSADASAEWLEWSLDSGMVAAGESQIIRFSWNARTLNAGDYRTQLQLRSNDPEQPIIKIPVHLTVWGMPTLSISASTLNFGNVYLSFSKKVSLTARNTGTDTLTLKDFETETNVFQVVTPTVDIPPGEQQQLEVTFSPPVAGTHEHPLIIYSNDPQNESYTMLLRGNGLIPPSLLLNPAEMVAEIEQEDSLQKKVRLQNTSFKENLRWVISDTLPGWLALSSRSGSLEPRAVMDLPFILSAVGAEVGRYSTEINFQLSDETSIFLPVTLKVVTPNQPPVWADSLLEYRVHLDQAEATFNLAEAISDPEGDALRFEFQPEGKTYAMVQIVGSVLTLKPETVGNFRGRILATDERGNQSVVEAVVKVLPPNQPPESVSATVELEVRFSDEYFEINLDSLFFDPDGDALIYSFARPSFSTGDIVILEDAVVRLNIQEQQLIGQTSALGDGNVIVYAYDPGGAYTTTILSFSVLPLNRDPFIDQTIDPQQLIEQDQLIVDISTLFGDPDDDVLTYQVAVADSSVAAVSVASTSINLTGLASGETTVTITARDEAGGIASFSFTLTVVRVTAIASAQAEATMRLYPNPASDWVTVAQSQVEKLEIYDPQGRKLYEHSATTAGEISFSVSFLPQGVYQVVVFTRHGEVHRSSLVRE